MSSLRLTEPFPSCPSAHMHTGRGGAGNVSHVSASTNDARNMSPLPKASSARRTMVGGRGGAGNAFPYSERAIFSFDEEIERLNRADDNVAPVYHIGRGGSGNLVDNRHASEGARAAAAGSRGSLSSAESGEGRRGGSLDWVKQRFSRGSK